MVRRIDSRDLFATKTNWFRDDPLPRKHRKPCGNLNLLRAQPRLDHHKRRPRIGRKRLKHPLHKVIPHPRPHHRPRHHRPGIAHTLNPTPLPPSQHRQTTRKIRHRITRPRPHTQPTVPAPRRPNPPLNPLIQHPHTLPPPRSHRRPIRVFSSDPSRSNNHPTPPRRGNPRNDRLTRELSNHLARLINHWMPRDLPLVGTHAAQRRPAPEPIGGRSARSYTFHTPAATVRSLHSARLPSTLGS